MTDEVWYYLENHQQMGPVERSELQDKLRAGTVRPDDLVWSPSMNAWEPASSVPDLIPAEVTAPTGAPPPPPAAPIGSQGPLAPAKPPGPTFGERMRAFSKVAAERADDLPHIRLLDRLLDRLHGSISTERLHAIDRTAVVAGHWGYLLTVLFLFLAWIVIGVRTEGDQGLSTLFLVPVGGLVLHYIATRFLGIDDELLSRSPSRLTSHTFLRCAALLAWLAAFAVALWALFSLFNGAVGFDVFAGLLAVALALAYVGAASLRPEILYIRVSGDDASAADESLGVLTYLVKLPLKLVPVAFGVGALAAAAVSLWLVYRVSASDGGADLRGPIIEAVSETPDLLMVALLPVTAYLIYLAYYLLLAVLQALVSLRSGA
jgi:hypothetical protein